MRRTFNYDDYIGQKINRLEILSVEKGNNGMYIYKCKCDCGNFFTTRAHGVINGYIKSCGCYRKDAKRSDEQKQKCKEMGLKNRKHEEKCDYCGANNHYANGLCRNCYERLRRNHDLVYRRTPKNKKED